MSSEKREQKRQLLHLPALMVDPAGGLIGECMLVNVSATGAKLTRLPATQAPDKFDLVLTKHGTIRRHCEVAWRTDTDLGVRFVFSKSGHD